MGLVAFTFFVVPWMVLAAWLSRHPNAIRLGLAPTPWRPLTDNADPERDQRQAIGPHNTGSDDGSGVTGGDKHSPLMTP